MSNSLLQRLVIIFGQPDSADPQVYLQEVAKLLSKYSETQLQAGCNHLLKTHRTRTFPTPAQIITAIEDHLASQSEKTPIGPKHPEWQPAAKARADRLIQSEMGRKAAREGWILSLHDYCRKHNELPPYTEVSRLKEMARGFEEAYSACCRGDGGTFNDSLRAYGEKFLKKREKYALLALGDAA